MQTKSDKFLASRSIENSLETMIVTALKRGMNKTYVFIDQTLQVFELSEETEMLRNGIGPAARELSYQGYYLLKEIKDIQDHLRALRNVDATLLILNQLLALLGEYERLFQFLEQKRYFESMRCVQRLKQSHLPNLRKVFRIIGTIDESLDKLSGCIHRWGLSNLQEWLADVREKNLALGFCALF
ncbi:MAG: hypothetical protein EZS28_031398 [Streblomastix strix]|uniref:Exocyst complex component EXOC6/Sec15 N-terminal domain-containing protein n=1 Tax=Streblomastix strix TaxID=222440 RepID=A0A5J4US96_9EUKA|nr:MAG: hypothetical protein EZS28_031398 [Streblomastix strix]